MMRFTNLIEEVMIHIKCMKFLPSRNVNHKGSPTVILALTTKGYGVGSREADNTTHQVKKLSLENIKSFRDRFDIPVTDKEIEQLPYVRPLH